MKTLNIDIETYSGSNLSECGVYRYSEDPAFEVLLFSVSIDGGPVRCYDLMQGEKLPYNVISGLKDSEVKKIAYNAQFERICLSRHLGIYLSPESWRCTMVHALTLGLPGSLEAVGAVLGLEKQKMKEGRDLIKLFSIPTKPTKANGNRKRTLPSHAPDRWEKFKEYNVRDVETEMAIAEKIARFPVPDSVWEQYVLDQYINDAGVGIDITFAEQAIACDEILKEKYLTRAQKLTGLENPNSPIQLKDWLNENGVEMDSLAKSDVDEMLEIVTGAPKEVLQLRKLLSKSSVKKYKAMENCRCSDGRAHGLLQFVGAGRTGRWAGRLIQVQNLPQNHISDLEVARKLIRSGCFEAAELLYDSVPDTLSQLIRTAFVPEEGRKFIVADFSAVEARYLSWMAGEKWRMDVFEADGDIYSETASRMFGVPVSKHGPNAELRQKGKISELALGYGGSVGALKQMGALKQGLEEDELQPLVNTWRSTNPKIVSLWWDMGNAVIKAVKDKTPQKVRNVSIHYESGFLIITLPSGRSLYYARPRVDKNEMDRDQVTYEGVAANKHWERIESYGPKFIENVTQAACRDLLAEAMLRLDRAGYKIVMHVHDEVVIEAPMDADVDTVCQIMGETPSWAEGLKLTAAGYECQFYQKD
jgi:DNA polymerase